MNLESNNPSSNFNPYVPPEVEVLPKVEMPEPYSPSPWNWALIIASWFIILTISLFLFAVVAVSNAGADARETTKFDLMQANALARHAVGTRELFGESAQIKTMAYSIDSGPLEQRYCSAILINELVGPEKALEYLEDIRQLAIDDEVVLNDKQRQMERSLRTLFLEYKNETWEPNTLNQDEQNQLADELGWSGEMVMAPAGTPSEEKRAALLSRAKFTTITFLSFAVVILTIGFLGLAAVSYLGYLIFSKNLKSHFNLRKLFGGIYVETFALWMVAFVSLQIIAGILMNVFEIPDIVMPFLLFSTLFVLAWPLIRGIPFDTLKSEIGLKVGNPIKEVFCGIFAYLAAIPFIVMAVVFVSICVAIWSQFQPTSELAPPSGPSHPIQEEIASSKSIMPILNIFFMACVVAPIMEETVFRGLLYRHLREISESLSRWLSVALSATISSIIFAMIHPQGIFGIPVLATLAIAFSLAREWRGSLIAPMTMHAINNSAITCLLIMML